MCDTIPCSRVSRGHLSQRIDLACTSLMILHAPPFPPTPHPAPHLACRCRCNAWRFSCKRPSCRPTKSPCGWPCAPIRYIYNLYLYLCPYLYLYLCLYLYSIGCERSVSMSSGDGCADARSTCCERDGCISIIYICICICIFIFIYVFIYIL